MSVKRKSSSENEMNNGDVCFEDVSSFLYSNLSVESRATLRLVNMRVEDAINANVRGLRFEAGRGDYNYEQALLINLPRLVSKLPLLESIVISGLGVDGDGTKALHHVGEDGMKALLHLTALRELAINGCSLKGEAISHIKPGDWPQLQKLDCGINRFRDNPVGAVKTLLHLTALRVLDVMDAELNGQAISQIRPGDWPQLQKLNCGENALDEDPVGAVKALLCLTTLQELSIVFCRLNDGQPINHIMPGDWPKLQKLDCERNFLDDDPVGVVKALLHLTSLQELSINCCGLDGQAISQIRAGDWPQLQKLKCSMNYLNDDPVGAMKALLHLTSLQELAIGCCRLNENSIAHIIPGDWQLQVLKCSMNDLNDDPVGAVKALLCLSSLQELTIDLCKLNGEAITHIKPGGWPQLQKLSCNNNDFGDDPVGAMKPLLLLTALRELTIDRCKFSGEAFSQIKPGDWPQLQKLNCGGNALNDNPVGAMKALLHLTTLRELAVTNSGLNGEAISHIMPGDWPQLQVLYIDGNNLSDDSVAAVKALLQLGAIQYIRVEFCDISEEAEGMIPLEGTAKWNFGLLHAHARESSQRIRRDIAMVRHLANFQF